MTSGSILAKQTAPSATTIFALSSASGRAGVAVFRVSGPRADDVVRAICGDLPEVRKATLRTFRDPASGEAIDRGLVIRFAAPASFTGEPMVELHTHGGRAVILAMQSVVLGLESVVAAEPGEFAQRAFWNGKMDLTQAEGLADLIDADTEAQRRQALRQSSGHLSERIEQWRAVLLEAMGLVESAIDFSDEGDVAANAVRMAEERVSSLADEIQLCLDDDHRGEIVRDGFRVALLGPPNAGKSSLLNAFAKRDAAIVSDEPGTTRDVIDVRLDLAGQAVILTDTAGLRETDNAVEREGIRRSTETARRADLALWLDDPGSPFKIWPDALGALDLPRKSIVRVLTKADVLSADQRRMAPGDAIVVSSLSGEGLDELVAAIVERAVRVTQKDEPAFISQARHRQHLASCLEHLRGFNEWQVDVELRAEDLRRASVDLGRLTGRIDVEEVLGEIFGRFCIGK